MATGCRPSLLLIEDDPDTRYVLETLFAAAFPGVRIIAAESGEAALELATSAPLTAIVLDLGLRGMDGFEFARRLRAVAAATPIIVLTGDVRPETRERAAREGLTAFFVKPEGVDRLVDVLRRLLGRGGAADSPA